VSRQTLVQLDRTTIEQRLTFTHENYRMVRERLCEIIYWNPDEHPGERKPANKDVVEAAKSIVMLDIAVLHAEIANGLYKKPITDIAKELQYQPLPPEVRQVIIAAWVRGGLLPAAAIEQMVPAANRRTEGIADGTHL
jgi:hypothetical protein